MTLEVLECEFGAWPRLRWIVPADWWAGTVEHGRWAKVCDIGPRHLLSLMFGRWPCGGDGPNPDYWPMRVLLCGRVIWQTRAAKKVRLP